MDVGRGIYLLCRNVGKISYDVKSKGAELADVHALTRAKIVVKVSYQSSPNDHHLNHESEIYILT